MQNHSGPILGGISSDTTELSLQELEAVSGGASDGPVLGTRLPGSEEGPILGSRADGGEEDGFGISRREPVRIPNQGI